MSETPGNMLREYIAKFDAGAHESPVDEWDRGWNAALHHVCKELEELTSKIEGWELINGH